MDKYDEIVKDMCEQDLDNLQIAISQRRNQMLAEKLSRAGFEVEWQYHEYIVVYDPAWRYNPDRPYLVQDYMYLDRQEVRQMLDTARNLDKVETYNRMKDKVKEKDWYAD